MEFNTLLGKTLTKITAVARDEVLFETSTGEKYCLYHEQDCCESVIINDVCGDLKDLLSSPITMAEKATSQENPDGTKPEQYQKSFTWTFYKLATVKGYVTIRWYGSSNGYCSESVSFRKL
jgi:hypothetical protein